jgi:hypothetical protein
VRPGAGGKLALNGEAQRSLQDWIEKHLRLKANAAKSGTGRVWERKFLGFRLDRKKRIGIAPESLKRFQAKVREKWDGRRSGTSTQLRDDWNRYIRGWWGTSNWPRCGGPSTNWKNGFDGISAKASG